MNRIVALSLLVAIDLAAKAIASALLPLNEPIDPQALMQFVLRHNESGLGSWSRMMDPAASAGDYVISACGILALTVS